MSEQEIRKAEEVLGEPVLAEFSEDLRRTKRNLLIVSGVAIFAHFSKMQVTVAGFFGFKFSNPDQIWLQVAVLSIVGYLFIQFCWRGWDYLQYMRLRITGNRVTHVTVGMSSYEYGDYPSDPAQSTLYNWWLTEAKQIGNLSAMAEEVHRVASQLDEAANRPGNREQVNINHVVERTAQLNSDISKFENRLEKVEETINSARIPASLERFGKWFRRFSRSQIYRIILLDLAFPFSFGAVAILLTVTRFF